MMRLEMMWLAFILPVIAQTLLIWRLVSTGLVKRYPAFTTWMIVYVISMVVLAAIPDRQTYFYRDVWIGFRLLTNVALFAALLELINRILEHYPGLRRATSSGLFGLLLAASIVAAAGEGFNKPVRLFLLVDTGWNAASALYVAALVSLATYLDPRRKKNVILHERLFAANCALVASLALFATLYPSLKEASTWGGALVGVVFPAIWMRLGWAGEVDQRPAVVELGERPRIADSEATIERLERLVTRSID